MKNACKPTLLLLFFFSSFSFTQPLYYSNAYNDVALLQQRVEQLSRINVNDFFIFSHGRPGALLLMGEWKDAEQIAAWLKTRINSQVKAVRIFGCEFGKGEKGRAAVDYLQRALNVRVSASDNVTGKDGDWKLEVGAPYRIHGLEDFAVNLQCGGVAGGTNAGDDFDRDGICNEGDIDDDNDGVLDAVESPDCFYTATEANIILKISSQFTNPDDDQSDGDIQMLHNGDAATKSFNFSAYTTAQNPTGSNLFTIEYSTPVKLATLVVSDNISSTTNANAVVVGSNDGIAWSTALSPATGITTSSITFSISTAQAYQYYKIQTGSTAGALATGNTIGEITSTLASDYNPSAHPKTTCTNDTDGDDALNHLDVDSDGDGCYDLRESGIAGGYSDSLAVNASDTESTPVGANGFRNSLETAENGIYNGIYTYDYATGNSYAKCKDRDGDNVFDVEDFDDDNDGVADATESENCFYAPLEANTISRITSQFSSADDDQSDGDIQIIHNGDAATKSFNFNAYSTAQNPTGSNLFTIEYSTPVKVTKIVVSDNISSTANANAVVVGSSDGITWSAALSPATVITTSSVTFSITPAQAYKYYKIQTGAVAGALTTANVIGEITSTLASDYNPSAHPKPTCTIDTDNDGLANNQDLDSDGDGCSDAREAGATTSNTANYQFTGPVGTNGLDNSLETAPDNGIMNYTSTYSSYATDRTLNVCADTDGDGITDLTDIDDDNDGVLDTVEPSCIQAVDKTGITLSAPPNVTYTYNATRVIEDLVDGIDNNGYVLRTPTGTLNNAPLLMVKFTQPKRLTSFEIGHYQGQYLFSLTSTYKIQASKDNITWIDVTGTLTYNNTSTATSGGSSTYNSNIANISTPVSDYTYYRVYGISVTAGNGWATELYFKEYTCNNADTDGDNIENRLDLDSDGDGCSDAREAGATTETLPNYKFSGADVNGNGLVDAVENGTNGAVNYASTYNIYAIYSFLNFCDDTDNDAIPNVTDIDSDNDGVLNATEAPACYYTATEANIIVSITSALTSPDDNQSDGDIQLLHNGVLSNYTFNFDAGQPINGSALFIVRYPAPVALASMTLHNTTTFGTSTTARLQGSIDSLTWVDVSASVSLATAANKVFTVTNNNPYVYYRILGDGGSATTATYTLIAEITAALAAGYNPSAHPKNSCAIDTDADNILNQMDPDSDGDNCPDAVEAGVTKSPGGPAMEPGVLKNKDSEVRVSNAVVSGPYGDNGFANSIETSAESGVYNSTYTYSKAIDGSPVSDCVARSQVLPVRMLSFTAKAANKTVMLNWITGNEVNNQYFDIERSANGNSWSAIGRVEGKNRPGVHGYEFADLNAPDGASYYRLKQKDFDGKYVYSEVKVINIGVESSLKLYPNPAQNYIIISMKNLRRTDIAVYDASGKKLTPLLHIEQSGSAEFYINIEVLTTGLYILKAKAKTISFVKS